jgi:hypothetical protein
MKTEPKKFIIPEYALRFVKEEIAEYRRENNCLSALIVTLPIDAETSISYLQAHYSSERVKFELSAELAFGELLVQKVDSESKNGV